MAKLRDIGSLLGAMGDNYIKHISDEVLGQTIEAIKKSDLSRAEVCIPHRQHAGHWRVMQMV